MKGGSLAAIVASNVVAGVEFLSRNETVYL